MCLVRPHRCNPCYHDAIAPVTPTSAVRASGLGYSYQNKPSVGRRRAPTNPSLENHASPKALDNVSFQIDPGEIFGLVGPNGCGKTTLLRILTGLIKPDQGSLTVLGFDSSTQQKQVRQHLGVVFQNASLDVKLTVQENLLHHGHLYGVSGGDLRKRIDEQLGHFQIRDRRYQLVETLSGGLRRRVELAKALLHGPGLLVLDEPSTGLDPIARRDLWTRLDQIRQEWGVTVMVTTHLLDEAERCDRLAFLQQGKVLAVSTPLELKSQIGGDVVTITPIGSDTQELCAAITDRFGPWAGNLPNVIDGQIRFETQDGPTLIPRLADVFSGQINSVSLGKPSLEDVFVHMTGTRMEYSGS